MECSADTLMDNGDLLCVDTNCDKHECTASQCNC